MHRRFNIAVLVAAAGFAADASAQSKPMAVSSAPIATWGEPTSSGVPVYPGDLKGRTYHELGPITAGARKATIVSDKVSTDKAYRVLWKNAKPRGADAVINVSVGESHVSAFSWGKSSVRGTMIKFTDGDGEERNARALSDQRQHSDAAERNRGPILDVLRPALPLGGQVLEIASGTGQHVAHLAAALPALLFQPSEPRYAMHASIRAWTEGLLNVRPPLAIEVEDDKWGVANADAVLAINLIHIAPWQVALGLLTGAAAILPTDGLLYLYGPFAEAGLHTSASNAAFDRDLRARDPDWGIRDLETVGEAARAAGFAVADVVAMPANNRSVLLRKAIAGR